MDVLPIFLMDVKVNAVRNRQVEFLLDRASGISQQLVPERLVFDSLVKEMGLHFTS